MRFYNHITICCDDKHSTRGADVCECCYRTALALAFCTNLLTASAFVPAQYRKRCDGTTNVVLILSRQYVVWSPVSFALKIDHNENLAPSAQTIATLTDSRC